MLHIPSLQKNQNTSMEEEKSTGPNPDPNPIQSSLCEECCLNPSKYKCPGCSLRSCSLPCVKAHKQRTDCTGKKLQTQFVPLSQFDDNLLISDYNLLEEAKRVTESAQRMRVEIFRKSYFKLPYKLRILQNAAGRRKTPLLFLPGGMSKREKNQSRFDQRKKSIYWTIEWRFHSTDVVLVDHRVHENSSLCSVIEKHLKPSPWNHQLKPFCNEPLDSLKFFIQKNPKGARTPFRELDIKAPLSEQLANIVVVEYPVIHVLLPSQSYDFEVIKDTNISVMHKPVHTKPVNSPKGVLFKEEEIEEDVSSNPQVLDLMKHLNPGTISDFQFPRNALSLDRKAEKEEEKQFPMRFCESSKPMWNGELQIFKGRENTIFLESKSKEEVRVSGDMDFDFEQDLRDAYSDLMADINPDDFLDLDGGFAIENELGLSVEEELEEGEISGF